jgi:uncharacterized protein YbjT (DUF2867 family)
MAAVGEQGRLQLWLIDGAARAGRASPLRLSVLSTSHTSLGANQRAHAELEDYAIARGVRGTAIRPSIFDTSLLAEAGAIRQDDSWIGGAPDGQNAFIDPGDVSAVAAAVLARPVGRPAFLELTGPDLYSYTQVAFLVGSELGRQITYKLVDEAALRAALQRRRFEATSIRLRIERDRATRAGENARLTPTVREILGRDPSTLTAFLHEHRQAFNPADS